MLDVHFSEVLSSYLNIRFLAQDVLDRKGHRKLKDITLLVQGFLLARAQLVGLFTVREVPDDNEVIGSLEVCNISVTMAKAPSADLTIQVTKDWRDEIGSLGGHDGVNKGYMS